MDKMGLREIESTLPPGFRFYPSDEELVCHYLYKKVTNESTTGGTMIEVDLHTREPWELPDVAKLSASEWYFFSFRDRKYATGSRTNRATKSGYWKATGKDRTICDPGTHAMVGMRKTLVFYRGRAPNGMKTAWVMHEFRLETPHSPPKEDWVLCRVFHKKKGESTDHEHNAGSSPPPPPPSTLRSSSSLVDLPMADVCHDEQLLSSSLSSLLQQQRQQQEFDSNNSSTPAFLNMALLQQCSNLLDHLPAQAEMGMMMSSRCEDEEFGFLLDLGFELHGSSGITAAGVEGGGGGTGRFELPRWQ